MVSPESVEVVVYYKKADFNSRTFRYFTVIGDQTL